jgi:SAM-dependent methyltransferase
VLGEPTPHFPLYLVSALLVELVALRVSTRRPLVFGLASGVAIGTVGLAAEWGWSHAFMPLPWHASLLPEAAVLGFAAAVAGTVIGALIGTVMAALRVPVFVHLAAVAVLVPASVPIAARRFLTDEDLGNVVLRHDDLFATRLPPASFDLVHARFELTPLGRAPMQMQTYVRLLRPGGMLVVEDPDWGSWHFNPPAPAGEALIALICEAFARWGDAQAGRTHLELLRSVGISGHVRAEVLALPPGHPYLRLPLQFATALEPRLQTFVDTGELQRLRQHAEAELQEPGRWGTTFTLLQSWGERAA